jgi:hypothetical protein
MLKPFYEQAIYLMHITLSRVFKIVLISIAPSVCDQLEILCNGHFGNMRCIRVS